jgi:methionyl-tRNA formyltransferase
MIREIVEGGPEPVPQSGEVVVFPRRRPEESEIPACTSLDILYDFLRMLDAEGYPRAFLVYRGFHYEFSRSTRFDGKIVAEVTITREEGS